MSTGEGADPRSGAANRDERGRDQQIGVSGGDDSVSRIQLAARWAEAYRTDGGDSLVSVLKRFRIAYEYLDAVIHGVDPPELEPPPAPGGAPYEQPRWSEPTPSHAEGGAPPPPSWSRPTEPGTPPPPAPPAPPTEPRPWS